MVFWQIHYQILLMILLKEFIKLNINTNMIIKNAKHVELPTYTVNLEYDNMRDGMIVLGC